MKELIQILDEFHVVYASHPSMADSQLPGYHR